MTQNIQLLSLFSFPGQIPKWDAYFRLLRRFTIAESCWGRRKWYKTHYSLEKTSTFPSGKYSSPCYLLISTTEARRSVWFHLLPPLELAAATADQIPLISYFFLHLDSPGTLLKRQAAAPLQQGFAEESSPFCGLSVPAYSQWPVPFCIFQPAVANHPRPTAFMLQRRPSCI